MLQSWHFRFSWCALHGYVQASPRVAAVYLQVPGAVCPPLPTVTAEKLPLGLPGLGWVTWGFPPKAPSEGGAGLLEGMSSVVFALPWSLSPCSWYPNV